MSIYTRANTDWLSNCRLVIGVHWTAMTMPRRGRALPFADAVAAFDLPAFIAGLQECGAEYLILTTAHDLQKLPCPHPVLERLLPGRTSERDLLGEMLEALGAAGIHAIFYYNHSCNQADDPEWEQAVGYHGADKHRFFQNLCDTVGWMGERYGPGLKGWWFDSSYSVDPSGPHNSVTTDMGDFQFPWERYTEVAKTGFPDRLVTYNAGVDCTFLYTDHQDYWAGEAVNLDKPCTSRYLDNGLQWQYWTCLDDRAWVHLERDTDGPEPLYPDDEVYRFVRASNAHGGPVCFNVTIYQDGTISESARRQLSAVKDALDVRL